MKLCRRGRTKHEYHSLRSRLLRLQEELACKQQELALLQQQNGPLQAKHDIISTIADTMDFMYAEAEKHGGINSLSPEEEEIHQQLRAIRQCSGQDSPLEATPVSYTAKIVLERFKYVYTMPRYPGVADMTLNSYFAEFGARVRDLGLNLMLHRAQQRHAAALGVSEADPQLQLLGTAETESGVTHFHQPPPLERLKSSLLRLNNLNMSVALAGRHDLTLAAIVTSCEDPAVKLSEAPYQRYLRAVSLLDLTREQRCALLDASQVFKALISSNQQELKRFASRCSSSSSGGGGGVTANVASGSCTTSSGNEQPANSLGTNIAQHEAYRLERCKEEQSNALMRVVLRKTEVIWLVMYGYVYSQLSFVQIAELLCMIYPFLPAIDVFLQAVAEYHTQLEGKNE